MTDEIIQKYAEVLIKTGVNLYKGQCLSIKCSVQAYDFALVVSEKAYEFGSRYVSIEVVSNQHVKIRAEKGDPAYLDFIPNYNFAVDNERIADGWAFLVLDDTEEIDTLSGSDAERISRISKAFRKSRKLLQETLMKDKNPWCVAAFPGENWAEKVTGSRDVGKLWEILIPILKLDKEDPVSEWKSFSELIRSRADKLNSLRIDRLKFEGPGTNLTVGLSENSMWLGAVSETPDGRCFLPNIPTEEIFTTPDFRRTEGKVKVTMPLKVMEKMVEGSWFEFSKGRVVRFGADSGMDILEKFLQMDDGASLAGEIALVDSSSSIFQSRKLFGSVLYDENAACHLALGAGYPSTFSNSKSFVNEDVQKEAGCNVSMVHTDFMIGSPEISITAYDINENCIEIMKNGTFTI